MSERTEEGMSGEWRDKAFSALASLKQANDDFEVQCEDVYRLLVAVARRAADWSAGPAPGDLVVEVTARRIDPDAIGWLIAHDEAAYAEDGTGPKRPVWDVFPLNPIARLQEIGGERLQRWENAEFVKVPDEVLRAAGIEGAAWVASTTTTAERSSPSSDLEVGG